MAQVTASQATTMPPLGAQPPHVPSHDLDAEMSVLSAMLLAPTAIAAVSEHLKASDFYRRTHGVIFDVARGLFERGEPVDAITVTAKLEEEGQLELVGGRAQDPRDRRLGVRRPGTPPTTR